MFTSQCRYIPIDHCQKNADFVYVTNRGEEAVVWPQMAITFNQGAVAVLSLSLLFGGDLVGLFTAKVGLWPICPSITRSTGVQR